MEWFGRTADRRWWQFRAQQLDKVLVVVRVQQPFRYLTMVLEAHLSQFKKWLEAAGSTRQVVGWYGAGGRTALAPIAVAPMPVGSGIWLLPEVDGCGYCRNI